MPTILLIRHGESQSNVGLPTSSPQIVELTDRGWQQAKDIARFLKEAQFHPQLIVTSSYQRTKQTAVPTTLAFPFVREEEWPVHEFTYLSPSFWNQDTTLEERQPRVDAYWETCNPSYVDGIGSESFRQFIARVRNVKKRLENTELDIIALFSHEQFITALWWLVEPDSLEITSETMRKFRAFMKANPIPNGAIVEGKIHRGYDEWRYDRSECERLGKANEVEMSRVGVSEGHANGHSKGKSDLCRNGGIALRLRMLKPK